MTSDQFKKALSKFCTGVTIVTVNISNNYHGFTVNSFTSISLSPPLILFCRKNSDNGYKFISKGEHFAVNILSKNQVAIASRFANPMISSSQRFNNLDFRLSSKKVPVIKNCIGHLECRTIDILPRGDHKIYIGEVTAVGYSDKNNPLIYFGSAFCDLKQPEVTLAKSNY